MTPFEHEIIELHIALENWLGKGEGDSDTLLARFRSDFLMIPPGGVHIDYNGLVRFLITSAEVVLGLRSSLTNYRRDRAGMMARCFTIGRRKPARITLSTCAGQPQC